MKQDMLIKMYGTTPDSFKARVSSALKKTEEVPMKKNIPLRTVWVTALVLVLLTAVAYAAFPSQVTAFFTGIYGKELGTWLEKGDQAMPQVSFEMDEVIFTVEEVIYRDNALFGIGTIRPKEGSQVVIIPEDHSPNDPFGYDVHGAGALPEQAPEGAPTYMDVALERGSKLLMARAVPDKVGVDFGTMLSPETIGCGHVPVRDGSIRFSFELSDGYAIEEGETYTIDMYLSIYEMSADGELLESTMHSENWTFDIHPVPLGDA